jgi:hypothetical protein
MLSCGHHTAIFIISMFMLLLLKDLLAKFIITYTLKDKLTTWLCLIEGYLSSLHDLVCFKIEHTICSRVRCITKETTINRPSLKLFQLISFIKDKALATKYMEVTHLGCVTVHQLVTGYLLVHYDVDPVRNIARGIHCLSPEPSRCPMLIKHRPSHLTQGSVFPFHKTILERRIRTQKLAFKTQVMAKGFEARVSEFRAIVTADRSYGISVPLVPQPQHKISNKTKRLPFLLKKEHPHISRVVVHHNKDVPLPTQRSHTRWANKVHMEQLAWTLSHQIGERRVRRGYHLSMPTRAQTNSFSSLNRGNPWSKLSLLKRSKLK